MSVVCMYIVGKRQGVPMLNKLLLCSQDQLDDTYESEIDLKEILSSFQELRQINRILLDLFPSSLHRTVSCTYFCSLGRSYNQITSPTKELPLLPDHNSSLLMRCWTKL